VVLVLNNDQSIDETAAEHDFAGVVRIDVDGEVVVARAYGFAERAHEIPNRIDTVFAIASGAKTFTALTVMSLVEDATFSLDTRAREVLGDDLPLIDDAVTIEHLLSHRSGIGDYLDEDEHSSITDFVMPVPVHQLAATEDYLAVLDGHPATFAPGTRFSYCNSGYVVLALLAERAASTPFPDLVDQRVCQPAGMVSTAFRRTDELDGDVATGYLKAMGLRSNVLHLPVLGSGDGGIFSTAEDVHRLWQAFWDGAIVSPESVATMTTPHDGGNDPDKAYGFGFWLRPSSHAVVSEGYDAGISFRSISHTDRRITHTVISNWSDGAWPMTRHIEEMVARGAI
jgi:CubicO group peptidase (beta-lactamase class C family)